MVKLKKLVAFLLFFPAAACATKITSEFVPYTPELNQPSVFTEDLGLCRKYALDYLSTKGNINPSQIAQEGLREGSSKMGYIALSPWAPALGALGAASAETLSQLGLDSKEAKKIISVCMHDKGQKSGAYSVFDPNL